MEGDDKMSETTSTSANVFNNRNFRLIFFGSVISEIADILDSFALGFYILEITNNNAFLQGLFLALGSGAAMLITPIGGVFGDRFNKVKIIYTCDYIRGALTIAAAIMMIVFQNPQKHVVILFILGTLSDLIGGFFSPASSALLPEIVSDDLLQQANSFFTVKSSLNSIIGVVLAGILYSVLPVHVLFFAVGICYILTGISEMFIKYDFKPKEETMSVKLVFSDMKDGLVYLRGKKAIIVFMGCILLINFFFNPIGGNFLPYFIVTDLSSAPSYLLDKVLSPEMWSSVINVVLAVFTLLGALALSAGNEEGKVGHKVSFRTLLFSLATTVLCAGYGVLVMAGKGINIYLIILALGSGFIGLILPSINIPISTAIMKIVDSDMLSKVMGLISVLSQGLIPVSSLIAGAVIQKWGCLPLLAGCSLGLLLTSGYMLINRDIKDV